MVNEDQLRNFVTMRTEDVTFEGVADSVIENVTFDMVGDNYTTGAGENRVTTTNIGFPVEVRNGSLLDIENVTHMEAPASEFM